VATAFDVAKYIVERLGPMPAMKLQKLVYYSQAWTLVWDDAPLFQNAIEAWTHGPVVRDLSEAYRAEFTVGPDDIRGDSSNLTFAEIESIDSVLEDYGRHSAQWLSDKTHTETPWQEARKGLGETERGNTVISLKSIAEYYAFLDD